MQKRSNGEKIFNVANICFLSALVVVTIYPLLHVLFASVSNPLLLTKHTGVLLYPQGFTLEGYALIFQDDSVLIGYRNTLLYVLAGTAINLVLTTIGAFVTSRRNFKLGKILFGFILVTMFFGGGLIPTYLVVSALHLRNTIWAIILPGAISTWNLIIMRNSLLSIPESLEESAQIDGASEIRVLISIILPLSKAILAVMALFYSVGHWNSWFSASIYLSNREMFPLQLFMREILIINNTQDFAGGVSEVERQGIDKIIQYATIVVSTVPVLLLYPFLQKYFTKGVLVGGIKG